MAVCRICPIRFLENTGIVNQGFSTRLGGVSTGCFSSMNISLTRGDDPEAVKKES